MTATEEQAALLEAFERALSREAHIIAERPDLTWQQVCNRLQWSEGRAAELVDAEANRRGADRDGPIWFRTRTKFREAGILVRTLSHQGVRTCALTANGARLVSSSDNGSLRLWDVRTGAELARVDDPTDPVVSCAFDYRGDFLVTGARSGAVHVRDPLTLIATVEIVVGDGAAHCATNPVEPVAAIVSGTVLRVVELPSGRELVSSSVDEGTFSCCTFSGAGEVIVTEDDVGTQRVWGWSRSTLDERDRVMHAHASTIKGCAVSPTFSVIVTAGGDEVTMWGFGDSDEIQGLSLRQFASVNDCAISPDGELLVSVSDDRTVWVRRLLDLKAPISVLEGHSGPVDRCTFAADGSVLATASRDGTVKIWDPRPERSRGGVAGHHGRITAVAYSSDGSLVVSASADMTLKTWDPAPTVERRTFEGHLAAVRDCVVLNGTNLVASAASDGTVRFWDVESRHETQMLAVGTLADVRTLASSPDGSLLAVGHDRSVSLWELATGERLHRTDVAEAGPGDRRVWDCAFTPDGGGLLVACEDATLRFWDVTTWRERWVLRGHTDRVSCCVTVPDSALAVSGSSDGTLRLWDLDAGTVLHTFTGHTGPVWDCAVTADGSVAVSAGDDGSLRLWNIAQRTPIATFSAPVGLRAVALHPSSPQAACGDEHGWLRVIDLVGLRLRPVRSVTAPAIGQLQGDDSTDDQALVEASKTCRQCGKVTELLRFHCPHCGSEDFDVDATGGWAVVAGELRDAPELVEMMHGRQQLSQQHVDQGGRLFQQGLIDEALTEFLQAIEANPWNAVAHGNIGIVFVRRGQLQEALLWLERALEIDPNVPGAKEMVDQVHRQLA